MIPADGGGDGFHVRKDAFADDHAVFEGLKILAGGGDGRVVTVDAEQLRFGEPFKKPSGVSAATDGGVDDPLGAVFGYQAYDLLKKNWYMAECHCVCVSTSFASVTTAAGRRLWLNSMVASGPGSIWFHISNAMILPQANDPSQ